MRFYLKDGSEAPARPVRLCSSSSSLAAALPGGMPGSDGTVFTVPILVGEQLLGYMPLPR